jgi:hypothetical protein
VRIDDECRDPDLLAAEVRRLQAVIAAGEPTLTAEEREAVELFATLEWTSLRWSKVEKHAAVLRSLLERLK